MPRWAAVGVVYLAVGTVWILVLLLIVPTLIAQAQDLARKCTGADARRANAGSSRADCSCASSRSARSCARTPGATDAVGALILTLWTLVGGIVGIVTIVVLSFYFLVETTRSSGRSSGSSRAAGAFACARSRIRSPRR
jgi:predicted PurR-regulated permease PerM